MDCLFVHLVAAGQDARDGWTQVGHVIACLRFSLVLDSILLCLGSELLCSIGSFTSDATAAGSTDIMSWDSMHLVRASPKLILQQL